MSGLSTAIPDGAASTIAEVFIRRFISTFGCPKQLLTDRAQNFVSKLLKGIARRFKIKQIRICSYRPQSNSSLERFHYPLAEYFTHFVNKNLDDWDECLDMAILSYNSADHEGTDASAFELVFVRLCRTPSSMEEPEDQPKTMDG